MRYSLSEARRLANQKDFSNSILNYVTSLKTLSFEQRKNFSFEFLNVLENYLVKSDDFNMHDANHLFEITTELFPAFTSLWRLWAEFYFNRGDFLRSLNSFKTCSQLSKTDLEWLHASASIENVRSNLVDSWHWRMLNDEKRNSSFSNAIGVAIKEFSKPLPIRILDIGSGSGIFSILAFKAGAHVVACECDQVMCQIASECFEENGAIVDFHRCHSSELTVNPLCDILVTETFDCAIFGEHIVSTILDAKRRLLVADHILIPNKVSLIVALVESADIADEHRFECDEKYTIISEFCYVTSQKQCSYPNSPYTCTFLSELPNKFRLLSDPLDVLSLNFYNNTELEQIQTNMLKKHIKINTVAEGKANAIVAWFRMELSNSIEICTAPENALCWQQAIFPFYPHIEVHPDQELPFELSITNDLLFVRPEFSTESNREIIRGPPGIDLLSMNDNTIRKFLQKSIEGSDCTLDYSDMLIDNTNPHIKVASNKPIIRYISEGSLTFEQASSLCISKQFECILFWPLTTRGLINDEYITSVIECHIKSPRASLLPSRMILRGCLINSLSLFNRSRIVGKEERKKVYRSAELGSMDHYRSSYIPEIRTNSLPFHLLSDKVNLLEMNFEDDQIIGSHFEARGCSRNPALVQFLKQYCMKLEFKKLRFQIYDSKGGVLDLANTNSCSASAYVFDSPLNLNVGDQLEINTSIYHGIILINVERIHSANI